MVNKTIIMDVDKITPDAREEVQKILTRKKLETLGSQFGMEDSLQMKDAHKLCALAKKRYSLEELQNRLGNITDLI